MLTKVTNDLLALGESTSSLNLPKGTTAQRPSSPVAGMVRENTDDNVIEYYNGTEWKQVKSSLFPPVSVNYLVIAGGGGGGSGFSPNGGGGAGGYSEGLAELPKFNQLNIIIGAGGIGGIKNSPTGGASGNSSSFYNIVSIAGGGAGGDNLNGKDGGSGGGASSYTNTGGAGTIGQGFKGGDTLVEGGRTGGGGGGGASAAGANGISAGPGQLNSYGGNGGSGKNTGIITTTIATNNSIGEVYNGQVYFSGGGGGGYWSTPGNAGPGIGGIGGGTSGEVDALPVSSPANTGGGAGGNGAVNGTDPGGNGGSGVVILRMPTANFSGTYTGNPVVTALGSDTILIYKNSGTYTV